MTTTGPPSSKARRRKRADVLLVDDDPQVQRAIQRTLVNGGYTVAVVSDAHEAAREILEGGFDVVVSDVHMPGLSGTELLSLLRSRGCDIPVILMTGAPSIESVTAAVELGATQYLTKPFDRAVLLKAIERALAAQRRPHGRDTDPTTSASFGRALCSLWMAFQPIVSLSTGGPVAYEALVRSEEHGFLGPGQLFDHAERSGRVLDLGRAIRELCADAAAQLPRGADLFVNLHPEELADASLFATSSPLSSCAERVVLEITERRGLEDVADVVDRMRRLRSMGFRLAIDDLGAGYAGLTTLAQLEPEFVKLDMSLTRDVAASPLRQRLIGSMVRVCDDLGMKVVAEGVETVHELSKLSELGCDLLQGYHFSRPMPGFVKLAA